MREKIVWLLNGLNICEIVIYLNKGRRCGENGGYIMIAGEFKRESSRELWLLIKTRLRLKINSRNAVGAVADVDGCE